MIRSAIAPSVLAVVLCTAAPALANVTLHLTDRHSQAAVAGAAGATDSFDQAGPWDSEIASVGADSARAVQNSVILADGPHLLVSGDLAVELAAADPDNHAAMMADTMIDVYFSTAATSTFTLQGTLPAGGHLLLVDTTTYDEIELTTPGDFDLAGDILIGRGYVLTLTVHAEAGAGYGTTGRRAASLVFTVAPVGPIPATTAGWGQVKGAYR